MEGRFILKIFSRASAMILGRILKRYHKIIFKKDGCIDTHNRHKYKVNSGVPGYHQ
jgi:hypothetical protein